MTSTCGAELEGNVLHTALTSDASMTLPSVDFVGPEYQLPTGSGGAGGIVVNPLTIQELTVAAVGGSGVFDQMMKSTLAHLKDQFTSGNITKAEYASVYVQLVQSTMEGAIQFVLQKDQVYLASLLAKESVRRAEIERVQAAVALERIKLEAYTQKLQALTLQSEYARGKMQLATLSVEYCIAQYNLQNTLPKQSTLLEKQALQIDKGIQQTEAQIDQIEAQTDNLVEQKELIKEQVESQRAQTLDTRRDLVPISGAIGKQKDLQSQQIQSYVLDGKYKTTKLGVDAWITMKSVDEGLAIPVNLQQVTLNNTIGNLLTEAGMIASTP